MYIFEITPDKFGTYIINVGLAGDEFQDEVVVPAELTNKFKENVLTYLDGSIYENDSLVVPPYQQELIISFLEELNYFLPEDIESEQDIEEKEISAMFKTFKTVEAAIDTYGSPPNVYFKLHRGETPVFVFELTGNILDYLPGDEGKLGQEWVWVFSTLDMSSDEPHKLRKQSLYNSDRYQKLDEPEIYQLLEDNPSYKVLYEELEHMFNEWMFHQTNIILDGDKAPRKKVQDMPDDDFYGGKSLTKVSVNEIKAHKALLAERVEAYKTEFRYKPNLDTYTKYIVAKNHKLAIEKMLKEKYND